LKEIIMNLRKRFARIVVSLLFLGLAACSQQVLAQSPAGTDAVSQSEKGDETNLDTQLYLLVASNQDVDEAKMPAALEPLLKQLRSSLPFKNYKLAATLINRVKINGRLNLKWVGGPLGMSGGTTVNPSFNEFRINTVRLVTDPAGQPVVTMEGFNFGARIPIQTGTALASNSPATAPVISYEATGLTTDISMHLGVPVVVGTLHVGPSGDAIILVMTAKRAQK
jgi:hypothetical protein